MHPVHSRGCVRHKGHAGLGEPMLHRGGYGTGELGGIRPRERGSAPPSDIEKTTNDRLDALDLTDDGLGGVNGALVIRRAGAKLLGAADDDAERRRHFVRDTRREGAHGRDALGASQLLVALTFDGGDRQLALSLELALLIAQRQPPEGENQAGGECHAKHQAPEGPSLPVSLARRRRHRRNAPVAEGAGIHVRNAAAADGLLQILGTRNDDVLGSANQRTGNDRRRERRVTRPA